MRVQAGVRKSERERESERERDRERERKSESLGVCQGVHGVYRGPGSKH